MNAKPFLAALLLPFALTITAAPPSGEPEYQRPDEPSTVEEPFVFEGEDWESVQAFIGPPQVALAIQGDPYRARGRRRNLPPGGLVEDGVEAINALFAAIGDPQLVLIRQDIVALAAAVMGCIQGQRIRA